MAHLQQALADFGRDIGLPTLETGPDGSVQLRLESGALLGVAQEGEAVVVHWAEPVRYALAALLLRADDQIRVRIGSFSHVLPIEKRPRRRLRFRPGCRPSV